MGIAFYVYENLDEFSKWYKDKVEAKREVNESCILVSDMYIKPKEEKLLISLKNETLFKNPDVSRSIACYQDSNILNYITDEHVLVLYDKVQYDPKNNQLQFYPKRIGKPMLLIPVGRYYGDTPNKKKVIEWEYKFYDLHANRVNFILKEKK